MSVTVTGRLTKAATQFQAGESLGFGIRIGEQYYDRETKQKEWTNYEAVIFAKNPNQIAFYQNALVEGSIVEITGKQQKIKQFNGNNGLSLSIEIIDASVGYVGTLSQGQPAQQQGFKQQPSPMQRQPGGFPPPTGQPAPRPAQGFDDFDDDIPF